MAVVPENRQSSDHENKEGFHRDPNSTGGVSMREIENRQASGPEYCADSHNAVMFLPVPGIDVAETDLGKESKQERRSGPEGSWPSPDYATHSLREEHRHYGTNYESHY